MSIPPLSTSCAIACLMALFATSCSSIKSVSKVTGNSIKSASKATGNSVSKVTGAAGKLTEKSISKLRPSRIPITSVNTEALKSMPTGRERALAYQKDLDRKRYAALQARKARISYKPLQMPSGMGSLDDSGLLPPLSE